MSSCLRWVGLEVHIRSLTSYQPCHWIFRHYLTFYYLSVHVVTIQIMWVFFYLRTYVPLISEITLFWKFIGLPWQRWVWLCPSGTCFQFWMNYLLMITSSKIQNSQFDNCNNLDINNNLSKLAMKVNHEDGHPNGSPRYIVSSNWTLRWANKHEKNRRV